VDKELASWAISWCPFRPFCRRWGLDSPLINLFVMLRLSLNLTSRNVFRFVRPAMRFC
jgi:hypothetical protein